MNTVNARLSAQQAAVVSGISIAVEALRALQQAQLDVLRSEYLFASTETERTYYADAMRVASARISALVDAQRVVDSVLLPG